MLTTVTDVYAPFGGSITVYLKNNDGVVLASCSDSGVWSGDDLTFSFSEVIVYRDRTYRIVIEFSAVGGEGDYGSAYLTYVPYVERLVYCVGVFPLLDVTV